MFPPDNSDVFKLVLDLLKKQGLFGGGHAVEAAAKESACLTRLLVRQYMGEARVEILDDVPLPEEGSVLRHDVYFLVEGNAL